VTTDPRSGAGLVEARPPVEAPADGAVLRAAARSHGDRLRLKLGAGPRPVAGSPPLVLEGRDGGRLLAFRFGASVAIGLSPAEEERLLREVDVLAEGRHERPGREETELRIGGDVEGVTPSGQVVLRALTPERLEVVANILAKSALLDYHERRVAEVFDQIEPLARRLRDGSLPRSGRRILRQLGEAMLVQTATVGRAEVAEKPEITWDSPELDHLYVHLAYEFELTERDQALDRKLRLISTVANTYLELLNNRQALRVEWYIVVLIVVDVLLTLYGLWRAAS
jgi:uncharacterized Rmd1/YagE family protein